MGRPSLRPPSRAQSLAQEYENLPGAAARNFQSITPSTPAAGPSGVSVQQPSVTVAGEFAFGLS